MYIEGFDVAIYDKAHSDEMMIRNRVFQDEQGFEDEFDEIDENNRAKHMVIYKNGEPIATCRFFKINDEYKIGRIAVVKEYRGQGIGKMIVRCAEEKVYELGGRELSLSSQVRVQGFYEKLGYVAEGEIYMDQMCPHIKMRKKLEGHSL